ncbi:MAG TPA: ABC transporter ATP-binding protein, partial [Magnetospirillum sp.]|nr:ABC transporter ATP-binding protein [Magnetospirillum sp.]
VAVRRLGMPLTETLVLMVTFARLLAASLRIQDAWRQVLHALPAHAAVHGLLQRCLQAAEPLDASADIPPLTREIRLENVCYRHCGDAAPALSGLGIRIPAGAVTAVVGPSGAGKSTLAELLLGLTEADEGTVLVDGVPLCGVTRKAWNRAVGYVPQDAFLFHDTIRANLTMAAPHGDEGALWAALDLAAASDFVRALPAGLETRVGDRGTLLSGGQRQRLALARALAGNPKLLILDEATSALDRENEDRILETLEALRHRLTIVVIAHRPSTVALADHVVVLDHGRAVAEGDWSQVNGLAEPLLTRLAMH